jgi:hypothetical protein
VTLPLWTGRADTRTDRRKGARHRLLPVPQLPLGLDPRPAAGHPSEKVRPPRLAPAPPKFSLPARLLSKGHKVGIVDQTETAALKKAGDTRNTLFTRGARTPPHRCGAPANARAGLTHLYTATTSVRAPTARAAGTDARAAGTSTSSARRTTRRTRRARRRSCASSSSSRAAPAPTSACASAGSRSARPPATSCGTSSTVRGRARAAQGGTDPARRRAYARGARGQAGVLNVAIRVADVRRRRGSRTRCPRSSSCPRRS